MGRFKAKVYIKYRELSYKQRVYAAYIRDLSKYRLSRLSINKLKTPLHSAIGRVKGKISIRARVSYKKFYVPNPHLSNRFFLYRVINRVKNNRLCVAMSNKNTIQYFTFPFNNILGETLYRFKTQMLLDEEQKRFILRQQGTTSTLRVLPTGTYVYNLEQKPNKGPAIARSFGSTAQILTKQIYEGKAYASVKLPSKKVVYLSLNCVASLGRVSFKLMKQRTAGYSYRTGRRPHVRGVAMNPVDHPHGGGEGKKSNPSTPKNPWGTASKWKRTIKKGLIEKRQRFLYKIKRFSINCK